MSQLDRSSGSQSESQSQPVFESFDAPPVAEARRHPRLRLPAMYTLVRIRTEASSRFTLTGHIYDISASGMRFEVDQELAPGTRVVLKAMLPDRKQQAVFAAEGTIVRVHDDEDGPVRMGLQFDRFITPGDQMALMNYLDRKGVGWTSRMPDRRAA